MNSILKNLKFHTQIIDNKYYISIFIFICCFFLASQIIRYKIIERKAFVMDELVDTQIGVSVSKGYKLYSNIEDGPYLIRTPLLTYIIGLAVDPLQGSYKTAIVVRKMMWAFSLLVFLFTYLAARRFKGKFQGILSIMLLCCFTTFLERSFRIRADLLSTLFSMPALVVLCGTFITLPQLTIAGFFLGLAFLTTQKAIYFILSFYAALVLSRVYISGINIHCFKKMITECFSVFFGLVLPMLFFLFFNIEVVDNFLEQCFTHAVHAGLIENIYSYTWKYLVQSFQRDPLFWLLGLAGITVILFESMKSKKHVLFLSGDGIYSGRRDVAVGIWSLSLLSLLFAHKIKFPYLFINLAPTLSVSGSLILAFFLKSSPLGEINKRWRFKFYGFGILIIILFFSIHWHYKSLQKSEILKHQQAIMDRVDQITKIDDSVFDGVGIAVTRKKATPYSITARWYNERNAGAEFNIVDTIKRTQPKALIKNYRFKRLQSDEIDFINNYFVHDWSNIFVVGKKIKHNGKGETKIVVNILASTDYTVFSSFKENILIDGSIPEPVVFLSSGDHKIVIKGHAQVLLLKYFAAANMPLAFQNPLKLFPSY